MRNPSGREYVVEQTGRAGTAILGALVRPATSIDGHATCSQVDAVFARDPHLSSIVVLAAEGRVGLVARAMFSAVMSGPYGYGRALHANTPVASLADWDPLVLPAETSVELAAQAALARGEESRYHEILTRLPGGEPGVVTAAAVFERLAAEYGHRAQHETLTGLANRELFLDRLAVLCAAAQHDRDARVGVVYVDLDRFKAINDTLGHGAGDLVLQAVATRLQEAVRPQDVVARLGGDEFGVLLDVHARVPAVGPVLQQLGSRILAALAAPVEYQSRSVVSTASIGVSVSGAGAAHADTLLREADLAMYRAKRAGGNQLRLVEDVGRSLEVPVVMSIDDSLQRGLDAGQFRVHYQPIVRLGTGEVASVEALVRWQHPERGLLLPGQFLPAAESNGTVVELGGWVLEQACRQLAAWGADAPCAVNVNVSVRQLLSGRLPDQVASALSLSGLAASRLRLELPETATVSELEPAHGVLTELRARGVRLTLDDVGSGANSLRHLTSFDVDGIKIDRSFVRTMLTDRRDLAVVRMLIELADTLGVAVTAEGVETQEQRDALVALGCGFAQGYLFARPTPPEQVDLSRRPAGTAALPAGR